ncbi:ornithine cyclodeaminase family protein [Carboxylicivirga mesophila]|uniref:Ornithine cyclodeaminase family protein n=1 Tax=Carboxylicivirga mesophila TaxID=1166478 RepID=A0ABS5K9A1_9BACT|nr:ornithine cyclodeaminase family protein [Carboxylicivirga mesophila]MBS2211437.1 ornithine cyclodeaminase family protein [Carboxylicivirga mesophila]
MRILSSQVIEQAATPTLWTDIMELALRASADQDYFTPNRMHVDINDNTLLLMPAVGPDMFATKLVSVFPGNSHHGKAVINGTVLLNDGATGAALALFNGAKLTAMRTAAVACVGIRHLSDPLATTLGIIGGGAQGRHIAWMACHERDFERVYVYDRSPQVISDFISFMAEKCPNVDVALCEDAQQVVVNCEVVVTATTSPEPVIPNLEDLIVGKCFICVGSYKPDMREIPESIFRLIDSVWIDAEHGKTESGDLLFPLSNHLVSPEQIKHISLLLNEPGALGFRETRLFKTVGEGTFDLFAAKLVYEKAREGDLGEEVSL